jgi:hypothetical protein
MAITDFKISFENHREIVSFGIESLEYEPGGISFKIASTPDSQIMLLLQHFRNQRELLIDSSRREMSKGNENSIYKISPTIGAVNYFFGDIVTEYERKNNSRINELIFLFPLAELLMQYRSYYGYKSIAERVPNYITKYLPLPPLERTKAFIVEGINDIKNPQKLIKDLFFAKKEAPISDDEKTYRALDHIALRGFSKELIMDLLLLNHNHSKEYYEAALAYCEEVISNLEEIRRIKPLLREFIGNRYNTKFSTDSLPQWILSELGKTLDSERTLTLITLIALEQESLYKKKLYIRACPICKRTFLAHKHSKKYCSNPNPDFNGRTCQEIGNNEGPGSRMQLYPLFNSKRKSYSNWRKKQYDRHPEIFVSENALNIEKEINSNYETWYKKARGAVSLYEIRKITLEEAESLINLPEIEYRSPLLYKLTHK